MAEFLVTCSLALYLIALLYGAFRVILSRRKGRSIVRQHYRKFKRFSRRVQQVQAQPDVSYYV